MKEFNVSYISDINAALEYVKSEFKSNFESKLSRLHDIKRQLIDESKISDVDLEYVLVDLPLTLIEFAEYLNDYRLILEVSKLKHKELRKERESTIKTLDAKLTATQLKELVDSDSYVLESTIYQMVLQNLIKRVETNNTYCKELIMGCKKIWDSRRSAETVMPVDEVDINTIPEYKSTTPKHYIK